MKKTAIMWEFTKLALMVLLPTFCVCEKSIGQVLANLERNWQLIRHADVIETFSNHFEWSHVIFRASLKNDMFQFPWKTF